MSVEQPILFYGKGSAGSADAEALRLLNMPTHFNRVASRLRHDIELPPACVAILTTIGEALDADTPTGRWSLGPLSPNDRALLADFLGQGEVVGIVDNQFQFRETGLVGVWLGDRVGSTDWSSDSWVEVGSVPAIVLDTAAQLPPAPAPVPQDALARAMNAAPLLHEIAARASEYQAGAPNHVINFTLLPLTEADGEIIAGTLGSGRIALQSGGYGQSKVLATHVRNVWAVQYLSAMDIVILDTLEIGGVPQAVAAAAEDFRDSAERLDEMLASYRGDVRS